MSRHETARCLLLDSRLAVDIDLYWSDELDDVDFERLRREVAFASTERTLVDLAEAFHRGPLSRIGSLDDVNWRAFEQALRVARIRRCDDGGSA